MLDETRLTYTVKSAGKWNLPAYVSAELAMTNVLISRIRKPD